MNPPSLSDTAHVRLSTLQESALAQLECWLPHVSFELSTRYLESSISQEHVVALAQVQAECAVDEKTQETWILASLPSMSETILFASFKERPTAFIDFIAELDALSETADHITHGYCAATHHSVLKDRGISSFTLFAFNELYPELQLRGQKAQPSLTNSLNPYQGLIVEFQKKKWRKPISDEEQSEERFRLEAISRQHRRLSDLALPLREAHLESVSSEPESIKPPTTPSIDHEAITPKDRALLEKHKQGPSRRTYFLFGLFLLVSSVAIWFT